MKFEGVFFDRDGTLGNNASVVMPTEFKAFPFVREVFEDIKSKGIQVYIFTNQSCIARGLDFGYDFKKEFEGYGVHDYFLCPHDDADHCECRKPQSGLLLNAASKHGLHLEKCLVVGDRWSDISAGIRVGTQAVLVRSGRGAETEKTLTDGQKERLLAIIDDISQLIGNKIFEEEKE